MAEFIFLICSERSGSNYVTSLFNGHPDVSGPAPTHLFRLFANNLANYGDLSIDGNWEMLVEDVALNFRHKLGVWFTEGNYILDSHH